jgi:hypothetical protein
MSRRDPALSGKCSSSPKDDARSKDGESWDGPGLGKWNYAGTAALAMHATGRRLYNFTEEAHEDVTSNQKVEHGATLDAKYKCIRFFGEDAGEGTYHRIRAGRFLCWASQPPGPAPRSPCFPSPYAPLM